MISRLRAWVSRLANSGTIRYTDAGNRSAIRLNYQALLEDRQLFRMATEYRVTGNFTGHLLELSPEDAAFAEEIRGSLALLRDRQKEIGYAAGRMWADHNLKMIENALRADPRLYNHAGALDYKSFSHCPRSLEYAMSQVLWSLLCYEHLSSEALDLGGLFTGLNSPYFTVGGYRINAGIRACEEKAVLRPMLDRLSAPGKTLRVMEIGGGNGQMANLFLREGAKVLMIDLPGMHAQAPFMLHKHSGKRICTYRRFTQLGSDVDRVFSEYDLLYLPPWEAERVRSRFDLAVNIRSLGEMDGGEVAGYLRLINGRCDTFFSVNTTLRGLDPKKQPEYRENSALAFGEHLDMKLCGTGTLLCDTLFQKTVHYSYALFSYRFAPSDFSNRKAPERVEMVR